MVKPRWEVAEIRGTLQYQVLTRYICAVAKRLRLFNTFIGFGRKTAPWLCRHHRYHRSFGSDLSGYFQKNVCVLDDVAGLFSGVK